jgi:hypothetical protein
MKMLIEFLSLRPVFTRNALVVIWYLYLVATVLHLFQYSALLFVTGKSYASLSLYYYFTLLPPLLFALAHLALMRIFLEMAQQFIDKRTLSV